MWRLVGENAIKLILLVVTERKNLRKLTLGALLAAGASEFRQLFPTVMLQRQLGRVVPLNARLRKIVLENERKDSGIRSSNVGGWHSQADFLEWKLPEVGILAAEIMVAGRELTSTLVPPGEEGELEVTFQGGTWANVLRKGGYNKIHNHPGALWSGCYYVSTGRPAPEPEFNGWIEFQDPRPGNIHGGKERVKPVEGMLLLFPGWLNHYVNPFNGKGERISIAFNLDAEFVPSAVRSASSTARSTMHLPTEA
ncbi:TIGR02466 family protein [Alphaproteobacteria bacterium]|nr:TIGR02466 family protein [Alphaproteobacteria bacterium]